MSWSQISKSHPPKLLGRWPEELEQRNLHRDFKRGSVPAAAWHFLQIQCRGAGQQPGERTSRPAPGRCVLLPTMPPGGSCPQQCRLQTTLGTDGCDWRRGLQICNEGSVAGSPRDPAGSNLWLLSTGGKRQAEGPWLLGTFPCVSEQVKSNQSENQLSLLIFLGWKYVDSNLSGSQSSRGERENTLLVLRGETDSLPSPCPADGWLFIPKT